ncbi:aminoacyl-histidine dipeptidase [Bacteroidia bacterium]|nr:aminoacyl-histidine dipeptidase [Bacteroidia bacterium]
MNTNTSLLPTEVWAYFSEISQIPRGSGNMGKITAYLQDFGQTHGLETRTDEAGNILIRKPATSKSARAVALQSHIDMVCEKNSGTTHDFTTDPIRFSADGDWVQAQGSTLGADNGIGVAAMLAVLAADNIKHGNLECLFTVDEEIGLLGALALKKGFLSANVLLNLDSEDEEELYIGCAGGINTVAVFDYEQELSIVGYFHFRLNVSGLQGGHSGEDINKERGNANKILARFLWHLAQKADLRISQIGGGSASNAIPREAFAVAIVPYNFKEQLRVELNLFIADIENELAQKEPNLQITLESETAQPFTIDKNTQKRLLNALYACPHGVIAMSADIAGLVETSTNLASVKMLADNKIEVVTSQRSAIESAKYNIMYMVESVFRLAGANRISHNEGYPGWQPNVNSKILRISSKVYERLFGEKPRIRAIHAGLECGLFLQKKPRLDIVSFGPTILNPHSPDEKVKISSVGRFWKWLVAVLEAV